MATDPETRLARFFHFLDTRQYHRMLGLMTPDVHWLRQGKMLKGHAQALATLEGRDAAMRVRHVLSNVVRDEAGDPPDPTWKDQALEREAAGSDGAVFLSSYLTAYRFDDHQHTAPPWRIAGPHKFSVVHTRFVRREGLWLISDQLMVAEFVFEED